MCTLCFNCSLYSCTKDALPGASGKHFIAYLTRGMRPTRTPGRTRETTTRRMRTAASGRGSRTKGKDGHICRAVLVCWFRLGSRTLDGSRLTPLRTVTPEGSNLTCIQKPGAGFTAEVPTDLTCKLTQDKEKRKKPAPTTLKRNFFKINKIDMQSMLPSLSTLRVSKHFA